MHSRATASQSQQLAATCKCLTINLDASQLIKELMGGRHEPLGVEIVVVVVVIAVVVVIIVVVVVVVV